MLVFKEKGCRVVKHESRNCFLAVAHGVDGRDYVHDNGFYHQQDARTFAREVELRGKINISETWKPFSYDAR